MISNLYKKKKIKTCDTLYLFLLYCIDILHWPLLHPHCWLGGRLCILLPLKTCPLVLQCFNAAGWMGGSASYL